MTTLLLTRHGETVDNKSQILQGQTQGELNETGRQQAREVRERMKDRQIDVFVSSDLQRSIETCEIIAAPHGLPVVTTPLLRERDWGGFTGKFIPDLQDLEWPDDIESLESMLSRARNLLTWIKVTYPDKTILAVGHGIINKAIQSVYYNKPMNQVQKMDNGEVRVLVL
ncbi:MAG: histidine phosphatase family protein [Prevotella sp.]|nr:histidine phosphatase family protein [Prevotella sp.]